MKTIYYDYGSLNVSECEFLVVFRKILVVFGKLPTIDFSAYEQRSEIAQIERVVDIRIRHLRFVWNP